MIADECVYTPDLYKDVTILVTLSAIPQSQKDCPKLGTYPREAGAMSILGVFRIALRGRSYGRALCELELRFQEL